jgi:hypothetical protein
VAKFIVKVGEFQREVIASRTEKYDIERRYICMLKDFWSVTYDRSPAEKNSEHDHHDGI